MASAGLRHLLHLTHITYSQGRWNSADVSPLLLSQLAKKILARHQSTLTKLSLLTPVDGATRAIFREFNSDVHEVPQTLQAIRLRLPLLIDMLHHT